MPLYKNVVFRAVITDDEMTIGQNNCPIVVSCLPLSTLRRQGAIFSMITSVIKLDVGGQVFATTLGTLTRDPSSKLAKLAYDKWLSTPTVSTTNNVPSSHPTVFIDRDPTHFRYILNYLRDGDCAILPNASNVLKELLREAEFYEIKVLQQKIHVVLGGGHLLDSSSSQCCCCKDGNNSRQHSCVNDAPRIPQAQNQLPPSAGAEWSPKSGEFVQWTEDGFGEFWRSLIDKVTRRGYVDWLFCNHCENDYEVRLPELPDVLYGCKNVKNFLYDMTGRLDSYVNEKCVYVTWKNVYCGKDGYLDSVLFVMHVPLIWLKSYMS